MCAQKSSVPERSYSPRIPKRSACQREEKGVKSLGKGANNTIMPGATNTNTCVAASVFSGSVDSFTGRTAACNNNSSSICLFSPRRVANDVLVSTSGASRSDSAAACAQELLQSSVSIAKSRSSANNAHHTQKCVETRDLTHCAWKGTTRMIRSDLQR